MVTEKSRKRIALVVVLAIATTPILAGCSYVANTIDMCSFTQGDGNDGRDASIHQIFYPGQTAEVKKDSTDRVGYFPCAQRNLRLMDGTTDVDADGKKVGPVVWRTSDHIEVKVSVRMDWTLNETLNVLKNEFLPLCYKYNCAWDDSNFRNTNFSTDGWSRGFLGENATPAFQKAVRDAIAKHTYDQVMDVNVQASTMNTEISEMFMDNMRATSGSANDLLCSSGSLTSGWPDSSKPGEGEFKCGPVRITVDSVVPTDIEVLRLEQEKSKAEQAKEINEKLLEAAKKKYGDKAGEVLGQIDIAKAACEGDKNCTVIVGNGMSTGFAAK